MITQKRVKELDGSLNVIITENHKFDRKKLKKYKDILQTYREKGTLITENFESNHWLLVDKMGDKRNLRFNLDLFPNLKDGLKCYALILISSNFSINHIQSVNTNIIRAILASGGFQKEKIDDYEEFVMSFTPYTRYRINKFISNFLEFINHEHKLEYDLRMGYMSSKNRDLPNYEVMIDFHYLIIDFEENATKYEKLKYYPVLLWWKITGLIPMRPKEFCLLEYDCCYEKNGDYFIRVPRSKREGKTYSDIDVTNIIRINKELFDTIQEYKNSIPSDLKGEYLFSFRIQSQYFYSDKTSRKEEMYHPDLLYKHVLSFYKEVIGWNNDSFIRKVVRNEKGEIVKIIRNYITPGDTRHFSMCNMMLQGVNPLTIAKMAGHSRLGTQRNYWGHIEYFVESYVYIISTKARVNRVERKLGEGIFDFEDKINEGKIYSPNDFPGCKEVKHGYCKFEILPEECTGECRYCKHFLFYPKDYDEGLDWLLSGSEKIEQQLTAELKSLLNIYKNMKFNLSTESYSIIDHEEALSKANLINRLIRQKAMIDSLLPKDEGLIS